MPAFFNAKLELSLCFIVLALFAVAGMIAGGL